jgi:CBS domain-containing protein/RNA polymerase-binding transcription factor DksA
MQASVKEWMTGDPVALRLDASALGALELMVQRGIRHLPVLDETDRVAGVVSIDDLRAALPFAVSLHQLPSAEEREAAREWSIGDVMTHAPETVRVESSLLEAVERMAAGRFGCLPVVDAEGRLEGILSETDALHALAAATFSDSVRERRERLAEHQALVTQLERERARIAARLDSVHGLERELATHRQREPLDAPDEGEDLRELGLAERLDALAARRLEALDRALDRAGRGELGVCETCGGSIPLPRLRALPGTTRCVRCAQE